MLNEANEGIFNSVMLFCSHMLTYRDITNVCLIRHE